MDNLASVNRGPVKGAVVLTSNVRAWWPTVYGEERRFNAELSGRSVLALFTAEGTIV